MWECNVRDGSFAFQGQGRLEKDSGWVSLEDMDMSEFQDGETYTQIKDYLIYNDPIGYADLILNGDPEIYLKTVTECKPLD